MTNKILEKEIKKARKEVKNKQIYSQQDIMEEFGLEQMIVDQKLDKNSKSH